MQETYERDLHNQNKCARLTVDDLCDKYVNADLKKRPMKEIHTKAL